MISLQEMELRVLICNDVKPNESAILVADVKNQYRRCGQPLCYVAIVPEDAPMPDSALRKEMSDGLRACQEFFQYAAIVLCGAGLKSCLKRAAFASMLLIIMKGKWHVASSIEELIRKAPNLRIMKHLLAVSRLAAEKGYRT
jgi:hypothetical protein